MPNTPWYLSPAALTALSAPVEVVSERDRIDGGLHWSVAPSAAQTKLVELHRAAFDYQAVGYNVFPHYLAAEVAGVTPYEWELAWFWDRIRAAADQVRAALAVQVAA